MAQPYFLVTASPKNLARIAKRARKAAGTRDGDPVLAVGSHRIVLFPRAVQALVDAADPDPITNLKPGLSSIFEQLGAEGATPLRESRLSELLAARVGEELSGIPRDKPPKNELVIDGFDWHIKSTRLVDAWELLGGPDAIDWGDVRVGQIDTGFRPHPALGFDDDGLSDVVLTELDRNFYPADFAERINIYDNPTAYFDSSISEFSALDPMYGGAFDGHGTRTGSVLAGYDPKKKYFGGAPRVPYIPVRVSDSVIVNDVQKPIARALEHLVHNGCGVITMSMGIALAFDDKDLGRAIDYAYESGVIFVTAAGNVWDPVVSPARLRRTLAIAGCTPSFLPWSGSSHGPEVDVSAPAWPIHRASVDRKGKPIYGYGDGTSFATPLVAATAALWLRYRRDELGSAYNAPWQRVEAFKHLLKTTVQTPRGWNQWLYGKGILDARALLDAPLPDRRTLTEDSPV